MSSFPSVFNEIKRCPYCQVAKPFFSVLWQTNMSNPVEVGQKKWATYQCSSCENVILVSGIVRTEIVRNIGRQIFKLDPEIILPRQDNVPSELPEAAANYLQQALCSLEAPDGAVMLANASLDAMLKEKGLSEGRVYERINKAVQKGIITQEIADWAHEVRLESNRPRHSDADKPHVTIDEANQAIEFVKMIGHILFVLPAKVRRGRKAASSLKEKAI